MKRLTLLRHAKSAWDDPVAKDFDRPLNARGRRAAYAIGQAMRSHQLLFDRVLASPARRVVETLEDVEETYGASLRPDFDERIYLAATETLLNLVRQTDDSTGTLLLVGHSPGLERLALLVTGKSDGELRSMLEQKYPTGALAEISLPVEHWADVAAGIGTLERFVRPRDLDPALGPED
jgi:phosphohistidine phosphatase